MCEGGGEISADEVIFDQAVRSRLQRLYRLFLPSCALPPGKIKYGLQLCGLKIMDMLDKVFRGGKLYLSVHRKQIV